jgi:uncharacterized protein (DUF1015 family)
MAQIAPFRALRYDPTRAGDPSRLIAPPYDVIKPADQEALEAQGPYNVVRLILPRGAGDDRYARAAADLRSWTAGGVLRRDPQPALYRVHTEFDFRGRRINRRGLLARIRLHRYEDGVVLPHERTLSGPKADRLKLKRACRAHLSPIFALYEDDGGRTDEALRATEARTPDLLANADGLVHRLWCVQDPAAIHAVVDALLPSRLAIADGHHRYETMLALRDEIRAERPDARSSVDFGLAYLCGMREAGLVVLPTHRLLSSLPRLDVDALLVAARAHFVIETRPLAQGPEIEATIEAILAHRGAQAPSLALVAAGRDAVHYLSLRGDADLESIPAPLRRLETALLEHLVLRGTLGLSRESIARQENLAYVHDLGEALARTRAGLAQAAFLLNPTPVQQILEVAAAGESMPQKSTFFHPKVPTGLVVNPIDPDEDVDTV